MDRKMERHGRVRREQRLTRVLLVVAAVLLFTGLFAQIAVRARISSQAKEIAAVQAQIRAMSADADNLTLCINQHHDLEAIARRALEMGMGQPGDDQLRVLNLPAVDGDTSTQTVANTDGEEING